MGQSTVKILLIALVATKKALLLFKCGNVDLHVIVKGVSPTLQAVRIPYKG